MGVWDTSTPSGSDPIAQGDDRIREAKAAIEEALSYEGTFPGPTPASAPTFIPKILKGNTASRPAASANYPGRPYFNSQVGVLQRVLDDGSNWEDIFKNPATQAIHAAVAASLASVAGVVTLPETGNAFSVTGTEAVTSIAGWSAGAVIVQWASARNVVHSSALKLRGSIDRKVVAGDIAVFFFDGAASCSEISFYGAGMGKEVGESIMWNGDTAPAGFLEENGASELRTDYPGLFAKIGTKFGAADGTHFNRPDSRGYFIRGYDHSAGNDPDAAARTAMNSGGDTGDKVGTLQADDYKAHTHTLANVGGTTAAVTGSGTNIVQAGSNTASGTSPATGGNETRPKNATKMFCIKY